jgi:hypothetical protein
VSVPALAQRPWLWLAAIFVIVFASRVPFIAGAGYGEHADAWRIARTAKTLVTTDDYQPSRPPGFPVHEWAAACAWQWRELGLNGLSAAASAAACVLLAIYARQIGCRDWPMLGLALAGLPTFYVNSVTAKDFPLTLALLLGSCLLARSGRVFSAAIVFGLVVGSRPVAVIYGLPIALVLLGATPKPRRLLAFLQFFVISATVAGAIYAPIFYKFGPDNLREPYRLADLGAGLVLHRGSVLVWGVLGLIGLGVMLLGACWRKGAREVGTKTGLPERWAWCMAAFFGIGFYAWLPSEPGYCIPALPFILLLATQWTSRLAFQAGSVLMMGAAFLGQDFKSPGQILVDRKARQEELLKVKGFTAFCSTLPKPGVVICGAWEPMISVLDLASGGQRYAYLLDAAQIAQLIKERTPIYYEPRMREFEYRVFNIDLAAIGAINVRELYLDQQKPRQP